MQTKKNIFLWASYDFANSIITIVFFLYFSQWLVVEKGVSDLLFNMSFVVSSLFLVLTAPSFLVKIGHPIFTFLCYYTYEIYVLHGLLVFVFHQLAMQGLISILFMWWLMPILLVVIFDIIYMKKYKVILN